MGGKECGLLVSMGCARTGYASAENLAKGNLKPAETSAPTIVQWSLWVQNGRSLLSESYSLRTCQESGGLHLALTARAWQLLWKTQIKHLVTCDTMWSTLVWSRSVVFVVDFSPQVFEDSVIISEMSYDVGVFCCFSLWSCSRKLVSMRFF